MEAVPNTPAELSSNEEDVIVTQLAETPPVSQQPKSVKKSKKAQSPSTSPEKSKSAKKAGKSARKSSSEPVVKSAKKAKKAIKAEKTPKIAKRVKPATSPNPAKRAKRAKLAEKAAKSRTTHTARTRTALPDGIHTPTRKGKPISSSWKSHTHMRTASSKTAPVFCQRTASATLWKRDMVSVPPGQEGKVTCGRCKMGLRALANSSKGRERKRPSKSASRARA